MQQRWRPSIVQLVRAAQVRAGLGVTGAHERALRERAIVVGLLSVWLSMKMKGAALVASELERAGVAGHC